jgi:prepilin peptidase dependent protein B
MLSTGTRIRRHQSGVGLVEFMIAVTLGLILVTGAVSLYAGTVKSNADLLKTIRLEQELHAVMDLMLGDLRRAGSHGQPSAFATGAPNPFVLDAPGAFTGETADSCVTFTYDLDQDGLLDTATGDERFGYRLRSETIEMRRQGLACGASGTPDWEPVTDPGHTRITALEFAIATTQAGAMKVRTVQIALSGEPVGDSSISRTLVREVRVQNDLYAP